MGKTLAILQNAAPFHTQPETTLVPATQFEAEQEPAPKQEQPAGPSPYAREFRGVKLDPYRILSVYGITDPAIQHAIKKLLRLGRGENDADTDVAEAIEALERWQEMQEEEA
jgi:hypothetical protein